jgi:hypothetical protein
MVKLNVNGEPANLDDDLGHSIRLALTWSAGRSWWQRMRSRLAYWLLARVDPLIARRKLRTLA